MAMRAWLLIGLAACADPWMPPPPKEALLPSVIAPPCPAANSSDYEAVETRCDGIDNDCDGLIDQLLPVAANRCEPAAPSCSAGMASCRGSERICLAQGNAPEVQDGIDNDCDGTVDQFDAKAVRPRILLFVTSYLLAEGGAEIDSLAAVLEQWGLPYDRIPDLSFEEQLEHLSEYSLAILPGYVEGEFLTVHRVDVLRRFVEQGGVLIVFKPVLAAGDRAGELLGLSQSYARRDGEVLSFDATPMVPTRAFDSPEERAVPLTAASEDETPDQRILIPSDSATLVGAYALIGGERVGAMLTRRALGQGSVYALGHDLSTFNHTRCYVNCFEPSSDLIGLFLREALRESAQGHLLLKHTVPGIEDSLALLSHDVDAPDAQNAGKEWGLAGAEQIAQLERSHAARGSYFITTDYLVPYYNPALMKRLCELGMCPSGVHSVRHAGDLLSVPLGDCQETRATYRDPETLCGEVRVPIEILEADIGLRMRAWRSPYLYVPPMLYDVLEAQGIQFDSSYAVGDLKYNLPLSLARTGVHQFIFHRRALYTLPLSLEDGIGTIVEGTARREEMQAANARRFESLWTYTMLRNADNGAFTLALLHPSYGVGTKKDNLKNKLTVERNFLEACRVRGVKLDVTVDDLLDFWRAREATDVDAHYDGAGYQGEIRVGSYPITNLTLEFGDAISGFDCEACGDATLSGRRVLLSGTLHAGGTYSFRAQP